MSPTLPAYAYTALISLPFAMQIAVSLGAPLGKFTVGGRFEGRLPPLWRGLALVQAALLAGMALGIWGGAGVLPWAAWAFWPALALTCLTLVANAASRSKPERQLWTPIIGGMTLCALAVALL